LDSRLASVVAPHPVTLPCSVVRLVVVVYPTFIAGWLVTVAVAYVVLPFPVTAYSYVAFDSFTLLTATLAPLQHVYGWITRSVLRSAMPSQLLLFCPRLVLPVCFSAVVAFTAYVCTLPYSLRYPFSYVVGYALCGYIYIALLTRPVGCSWDRIAPLPVTLVLYSCWIGWFCNDRRSHALYAAVLAAAQLPHGWITAWLAFPFSSHASGYTYLPRLCRTWIAFAGYCSPGWPIFFYTCNVVVGSTYLPLPPPTCPPPPPPPTSTTCPYLPPLDRRSGWDVGG